MRIHALLPWYQENPQWLAATVASVARFADHIIAVDGCYALWPDALTKPNSGAEQAEIIMEVAHGAGIDATVHVPRSPFFGNEVEKRTLMLRLAGLLGTPNEDWVFHVDADEVVTHVADNLRAMLAAEPLHVCEVAAYWNDGRNCTALPAPDEEDRREAMQAGSTPVRKLMRLIPNLHVRGAHWCYVGDGPDGGDLCLWGAQGIHEIEPAADYTRALRLEHRHAWRGKERQRDAAAYYKTRDFVAAERMIPLMMQSLEGDYVEVPR